MLGSGDGNKPIQDYGFFQFGMWESQTPCGCYVVLLVPVGAAARGGIPLRLWVWLSGVSLVSLSFLPRFFGFIFLDFLSLLGPGGVEGYATGGGLSQVGFGSRYCGGSPLFPVLSFVTVGHWVIGRPEKRV